MLIVNGPLFLFFSKCQQTKRLQSTSRFHITAFLLRMMGTIGWDIPKVECSGIHSIILNLFQ